MVLWICFGDFNDILSLLDKLGGDLNNVGHLQFISHFCTDDGIFGYRFTWSNKQRVLATIEERLDYVLVNDTWEVEERLDYVLVNGTWEVQSLAYKILEVDITINIWDSMLLEPPCMWLIPAQSLSHIGTQCCWTNLHVVDIIVRCIMIF